MPMRGRAAARGRGAPPHRAGCEGGRGRAARDGRRRARAGGRPGPALDLLQQLPRKPRRSPPPPAASARSRRRRRAAPPCWPGAPLGQRAGHDHPPDRAAAAGAARSSRPSPASRCRAPRHPAARPATARRAASCWPSPDRGHDAQSGSASRTRATPRARWRCRRRSSPARVRLRPRAGRRRQAAIRHAATSYSRPTWANLPLRILLVERLHDVFLGAGAQRLEMWSIVVSVVQNTTTACRGRILRSGRRKSIPSMTGMFQSSRTAFGIPRGRLPSPVRRPRPRDREAQLLQDASRDLADNAAVIDDKAGIRDSRLGHGSGSPFRTPCGRRPGLMDTADCQNPLDIQHDQQRPAQAVDAGRHLAPAHPASTGCARNRRGRLSTSPTWSTSRL